MKFINCTERLPEDQKNKLCIDVKGRKRAAFYTPGNNSYSVDFDDDMDADWAIPNAEAGTYFLVAGWYEWVETPGCTYDEMINKVNISQWLDESPPSIDIEALWEELYKDRAMNNHCMVISKTDFIKAINKLL